MNSYTYVTLSFHSESDMAIMIRFLRSLQIDPQIAIATNVLSIHTPTTFVGDIINRAVRLGLVGAQVTPDSKSRQVSP